MPRATAATPTPTRTKAFACAFCRAGFDLRTETCRRCGAPDGVIPWSLVYMSPQKGMRDFGRPVLASHIASGEPRRYKTGIAAMDRVLDGGPPAATVYMLAGAPGIGKTTIAMAMCATIAVKMDRLGLYISSEQKKEMAMRAASQGGANRDAFQFWDVRDLDAVLDYFDEPGTAPGCVVLDSLQRFNIPGLSRTRTMEETLQGAREIADMCKAVVLVVSHVNKDNEVAGSVSLEHDVDGTVLIRRDHLRMSKNRFGPSLRVSWGGIDEVIALTKQREAEKAARLLRGSAPAKTRGLGAE